MSVAGGPAGSPVVIAPGVRLVGDAALLRATTDTDAAAALAAEVRATGGTGVLDVVAGRRSVLVVTRVGADLERLGAQLSTAGAGVARHRPADGPPRRLVVMDTVFDGPDLDEVAGQAGCSPEAVVDRLVSATLTVGFLGFAPGFAYLAGLPDDLGSVRRRRAPRPSVPAGSVALAGGLAAVYPQPSPGGWQLVGRTDRPLFDPATPPFALLGPGDAVRFRPVAALTRPDPPRVPPAPAVGPITVVDAGLRTLVQDLGRPGSAHLGVARSGAADPLSHRLANRLVGNADGDATLEATGRGPTLHFSAPSFVAVVGGSPRVDLDGRPVGAGRVVPVGAGQTLSVGPTGDGLRSYVAVAGGLDAPAVLGSRATDTLSGLGPTPLAAGDTVAVGPFPEHLADHLVTVAGAPGPAGGEAGTVSPKVLRVLAGPHAEWFATDALDVLCDGGWSVDPRSDRIGVRLRRETGRRLEPLEGELDSQGMVTGALQVPPGGEPIALLADHATHGGYPVVAVVISADRWALGQLRVGDTVGFRAVGLEEARRASASLDRWVDGAVVGRYPTSAG